MRFGRKKVIQSNIKMNGFLTITRFPALAVVLKINLIYIYCITKIFLYTAKIWVFNYYFVVFAKWGLTNTNHLWTYGCVLSNKTNDQHYLNLSLISPYKSIVKFNSTLVIIIIIIVAL